jgi:nitrate reductase (NAD(P)H)
MLPSYHIGTLDDISKAALANEEAIARSSPVRPVFLQSRAWSSAILKEKTTVSPDSFIFTFHLDHENQELGVAVGQHFMMQLNDPSTKESIVRAYTPISEVDEKGRLRVLIKVYYATPERPCGRMTQALNSLPLGSSVNFQGPAGRFTYDGRGTCIVGEHRYNVRRFVMICGGSGITPIFQVLRAIMKDRDDLTECLVLYGNRTEDDILCRSELDHMAKDNKDRCRLVYSLTQPGDSWGGLTGRFDKSAISREVGPPQTSEAESDMALICGPEGMEKAAEAALLGMQWTRGNIVVL